ncbi:COG3772 Phage-related lysozyme (muraminidase) [uncultured Caudovirales phage]|uniref:Endolysin n=1 Tax=uncultured Caudovirales phage TaxID=2100421 RepID=A0A6J5L255_9CAUD|nr:COG3772 Phage-related lysozyme (muraminidase) [uncultured Caudovirales phage]
MKFSKEGFQLLSLFESFRSESYQDEGGVWTIGYGHTKGVSKESKPISKNEAFQFAREDIEAVEKFLSFHLPTLTQKQFDALVSFIFNIGLHAFENSMMYKDCLLAGKMDYAADEFDEWIYVKRKISKGLKRRRAIEKKMFIGRHTYEELIHLWKKGII